MNRFFSVYSVLALTLVVLAPVSRASAQLLAAKDGPIVYGHHHLNTTNIDAQKKFFVDTLGGTVVKIGHEQREIVKFPNVLIFFRTTQAPTGGTQGHARSITSASRCRTCARSSTRSRRTASR